MDDFALSIYKTQAAFVYEYERGRRGLGKYLLPPEKKPIQNREFHCPAFLNLQTVQEKIYRERKLGLLKDDLHKSSRSTQKRIADDCVEANLVTFENLSGTFIVRNPYNDNRNSVVVDPPSCSCSSTGKCWHIIATERAISGKAVRRRFTYSLSELRKKTRKGKSGKKKIRQQDYDYDVIPAPDSKLMENFIETEQNEQPEIMDEWSNVAELQECPWANITEPVTSFLKKKNDYDCVQRGAFKSLIGKQWLDDECLGTAVKQIVRDADFSDQCLVISPHFLRFLEDKKVSALSGFLCTHEALNRDFMLFIVNEDGLHWQLVTADLVNKTLQVFDSMCVSDQRAIEICTACLSIIGAAHAIADVEFNTADYRCSVVNCPQQSNGTDCGVYVVVNAYSFVNGRDLYQPNCSQARKWIAQLMKASYSSGELYKKARMGKLTRGTALERCQKFFEHKLKSVGAVHREEYVKRVPNDSANWSICAEGHCPDDARETKQTQCCSCRFWFHEDCGREKIVDALNYWKCTACNGDDGHDH